MWLEHHKTLFENIVIIDYNSTDNSINICKSICPNATIINSRNKNFKASDVDQEVMDIENGIEGFKIALNITEFLVSKTPLEEFFKDYENKNICVRIEAYSPYSNKIQDINNYKQMFSYLLNDDVVFHKDRGYRQLHNYNNGAYNIGRHHSNHQMYMLNDDININIIWFGYFPMNEMILKRKLQIQNNIPLEDKLANYGGHHIIDRKKILETLNDKINTGEKLSKLNPYLYEFIKNNFK